MQHHWGEFQSDRKVPFIREKNLQKQLNEFIHKSEKNDNENEIEEQKK